MSTVYCDVETGSVVSECLVYCDVETGSEVSECLQFIVM
jgi:hypothetical protein